MSRLTGLALALGCALLAGCQTVAEHKQANLLEESVRHWVRAIRWGEFDSAAAMIRARPSGEAPAAEDAAPGEARHVVPAVPESFDGLRVTAYEVQLEERAESADPARMSARFDYYFETSGRVRSTTASGVWWYDAESETWFLDGALPGFER